MMSSVECVILTESPEQIENRLNSIIKYCKEEELIRENNISDGYHTFDELYEFRKLYNAALFNQWAGYRGQVRNEHGEIIDAPALYDVHKSVRHFDGEVIFGGNWFIVVAILPTGQISNHYHIDDWYLFNVPIENKAKYPFDGHTPKDVLERLKQILL